MTYAVVAYSLAFAGFHLLFWRLFDWPATLVGSGSRNTAITQTLNIVLTYVFVAYGIAVAIDASRAILLVGAGFWLLRAALQFVLFRLPRTWNAALTIVFLAGAVLHLGAALVEQ